MARRQKNNDFITQGLRRYPEARATVRAFETALAQRIEKCITRRTWIEWKPDAESIRPDYDRSESNWAGVAATGRMKHKGTKTDLWVWVEWDTTDRAVHRTFKLESWPRPVWTEMSHYRRSPAGSPYARS